MTLAPALSHPMEEGQGDGVLMFLSAFICVHLRLKNLKNEDDGANSPEGLNAASLG
jgi:hypothetical protein